MKYVFENETWLLFNNHSENNERIHFSTKNKLKLICASFCSSSPADGNFKAPKHFCNATFIRIETYSEFFTLIFCLLKKNIGKLTLKSRECQIYVVPS